MKNKAYEWILCEDKLPINDNPHTECNSYYLVWVKFYGAQFAMRMDDEWWSSYSSKIVEPVTHWSEIVKPEE